MNDLFITECPRDAMQGIGEFIPTDLKVRYLNSLIQAGFWRLDFGSFVSPKAIPQLADTAQVLEQLDIDGSRTQLLAIVANERGADQALAFSQVAWLGFPLSISEEFQMRNTHKTIADALGEVEKIHNKVQARGRKLLVYLGMAFGNPYGEAYSPEVLAGYTEVLKDMGIRDIALADTIGSSTPANISPAFQTLMASFPQVTFSAHFHSTPETAYSKVQAAYQAGCRHFDTALLGYGGCPMAKEELTGNIATETLLDFASQEGLSLSLDLAALAQARLLAPQVFAHYSPTVSSH